MNDVIFPAQSVSDVKCVGDGLGVTLWQGEQWSVTTDGIERRDGCYFISKERIHDKYPWDKHLSQKSWVDVHDFKNAFFCAKKLFDKNGKRTSVKAPVIFSDAEAHEAASLVADNIYEKVFRLISKGQI